MDHLEYTNDLLKFATYTLPKMTRKEAINYVNKEKIWCHKTFYDKMNECPDKLEELLEIKRELDLRKKKVNLILKKFGSI